MDKLFRSPEETGDRETDPFLKEQRHSNFSLTQYF